MSLSNNTKLLFVNSISGYCEYLLCTCKIKMICINKLCTSSLIAAVEDEGVSGSKHDESGSLSSG